MSFGTSGRYGGLANWYSLLSLSFTFPRRGSGKYGQQLQGSSRGACDEEGAAVANAPH